MVETIAPSGGGWNCCSSLWASPSVSYNCCSRGEYFILLMVVYSWFNYLLFLQLCLDWRSFYGLATVWVRHWKAAGHRGDYSSLHLFRELKLSNYSLFFRQHILCQINPAQKFNNNNNFNKFKVQHISTIVLHCTCLWKRQWRTLVKINRNKEATSALCIVRPSASSG